MTEKATVNTTQKGTQYETDRVKYYSKPSSTEYEVLRCSVDNKIMYKIIRARRYPNGVIKRRLITILRREDQVEPFIAEVKKRDKEK